MTFYVLVFDDESRPTRARGLKQAANLLSAPHASSRPTRARGLKLAIWHKLGYAMDVAPHAGAWIETVPLKQARSRDARRAPRGRVD